MVPWSRTRRIPGATPESPAPAVEGVGQGALGTGGTDTGRYYRLKSAISGGNVCLDVEGKSQSNGARVLQWTCSGTGENQRWYARQISSAPDYQLSAKHSAKCLRSDGGSAASGARMEQDACGHATSQTRLVLTRAGHRHARRATRSRSCQPTSASARPTPPAGSR